MFPSFAQGVNSDSCLADLWISSFAGKRNTASGLPTRYITNHGGYSTMYCLSGSARKPVAWRHFKYLAIRGLKFISPPRVGPLLPAKMPERARRES